MKERHYRYMIFEYFQNNSAWKHIATASIILIFVTGAPYLYGYVQTPPGATYTGLHALTPGDFNVYYAQMLQAGRGDMAERNLFAGIDGVGSISMVNAFWYCLGIMAHTAGISMPLAFHLARLALIPLLVLVLHQLLRILVPFRAFYTAGVLTFLGSGIGYLALPFLKSPPFEGRYDWPLDLWVPEANTFLTLYHSPHLLASLILFLFVLFSFLRASASSKPFWWRLSGGLAAAALFHFHPFHAVTLGSILLVWTVIMGRTSLRRSCVTLAVISGISLPSIAWQLMRLRSDWITREWAMQNVTTTPALWAVLLGYGLLVPLALAGGVWFWRVRNKGSEPSPLHPRAVWLLGSWIAVQCAFVLSPLPFQRRLLEGMHVPLAMLAGVGMCFLFNTIPWHKTIRILRNPAMVLCGIIFIFSTVGTISRDLELFTDHSAYFYLNATQKKVLDLLMRASLQEGVVLAPVDEASFIPAWTGRAVYGGSGAHSPQEALRRSMAEWFLSGQGSREARRQFLRDENITDVVMMSSDQRDMLTLAADSLLHPVFVDQGIGLFSMR
ncbi:hypothetical protein A3I42_01665 [Candidatus Uhrbacteria bacterium RIFCSPLOWO2_02_FULL_49_11]|uniref:Glycosyltransferase RgtA/B/C/D-like domain-containing protein n=1 Tax=Candidatus Uhrbacteria bacterium RIFCSPLOWO2_02_FULL_49_11 TaxID=1802409 RepID=A0A1F7VDS9_9BACT|nr:MAG: hypothetical protein A3I42_01665 [Candidatus Uhrbacteria bacterium RIFCSPLOWO2_02_FULL_49_11]